MEVLTITTVCKSFRPVTFWGESFCILVNGFELSIKTFFLLYDTHFKIMQKMCMLIQQHFLLTLKPNADETAQKNGKKFFFKSMCLRIPFHINFRSAWEAPFCQKKSKSLSPCLKTKGYSVLNHSKTFIISYDVKRDLLSAKCDKW